MSQSGSNTDRWGKPLRRSALVQAAIDESERDIVFAESYYRAIRSLALTIVKRHKDLAGHDRAVMWAREWLGLRIDTKV